MRNAITDPVTIALIALASSLITAYFEFKSDSAIAKAIYDTNATTEKIFIID
ncbi:hypothetical protein KAU11_06645 [Candidatus Babeliales bacterium]|nr:hypothetical protein [Candidatus Babeliales bacterium]